MDQSVYQYGITLLLAHCIFYVSFKYALPKGPWTSSASYTAHQAVCMPLMIYLGVLGVNGWFLKADSLVTVTDRCLSEYTPGIQVTRLVLGMMIFWDIPVGLLTPQLQDPLMLVHHIGMLLTAGISEGLLSNGHPVAVLYTTFYFGVIELSSIPLVIVDLFHPKNKEWHAFHEKNKFLQSITEIARVLFALMFVILRCIYFPYVGARHAIPDFYRAATSSESERNGVPAAPFYMLIPIIVLFGMLQLFWGSKVLTQVLKVLSGDKVEKQKKSS